MRTEKEMFDLILSFAKNDDRVRIVGMEGSRTNPAVLKDAYQDYDITYLVTDMDSFLQDDDWLSYFGGRIFMQKPEPMNVLDAQLGTWFSYLMLFEDGVRIDLTLVPIEAYAFYLSSDSLLQILLDKDCLLDGEITPTDKMHRIKKPTQDEFDACCNEFWWISTYVTKGILRKQMIYAVEYMNQIVRRELLNMLSWKIGMETDFSVNLGQNDKFLERYVTSDIWERLVGTYSTGSYEELWVSLFECHALFREFSTEVADSLDYPYPDYDEKITGYIKTLYREDKIIE